MVANIGELAALATDNFSAEVSDNVSTHSPVLREIFLKGNNKPANGGNQIRQDLAYAENSTAKWFSGTELLDISSNEQIDSAQFSWKQFNVNLTITGLEKTKVKGEAEIHDLVETKLKNMKNTAINWVATGIFSDGTTHSGKTIGGLQLIVADTPTNTVGGIDANTYTFWQNKTFDFSSEGGGNASASNILTGLNVAWRRTMRNMDQPDIAVMDDDYFGYFEAALQANQRFMKPAEAEAGFESYMYKSAKAYYDSNCPDLHGYLLNTDYLFFRFDPDRNFTREKEKAPTNQDVSIIPLYWSGNLTCSNRSLQCVLKN